MCAALYILGKKTSGFVEEFKRLLIKCLKLFSAVNDEV